MINLLRQRRGIDSPVAGGHGLLQISTLPNRFERISPAPSRALAKIIDIDLHACSDQLFLNDGLYLLPLPAC